MFVKEFGFRSQFDLTPRNSAGALGTIFLGSGGLSANSFDRELWRENNSIKFEISQPAIEVDGNLLEFGGGAELDFNGDVKIGPVLRFQF